MNSRERAEKWLAEQVTMEEEAMAACRPRDWQKDMLVHLAAEFDAVEREALEKAAQIADAQEAIGANSCRYCSDAERSAEAIAIGIRALAQKEKA